MNVVLGDLHGDFGTLKRLIQNHPEWTTVTIAGDVGLGFPNTRELPFVSPIPIYFIRGNHDNPEFIKNLDPDVWPVADWHYIPDGTVRNGVLYLGGAWSIDWEQRTPGYDWWPNEEIGMEEGEAILSAITKERPFISTVVTHDCPTYILRAMYGARTIETSTSNLLSSVLSTLLHSECTRPLRWFYGHHHRHYTLRQHGIQFRCLNTAQHVDIAIL